jgi:hypothetical protein
MQRTPLRGAAELGVRRRHKVMTEEEWLICRDPEPMLEFLRDRASSPSFRRFAVACCRRIWQLFAHEESRRAVQIAEAYAVGRATERDRREASAAVPVICPGDSLTDPCNLDAWSTEAAASAVFADDDYPPIVTYAATCAIAAARTAAAAAACAAAVGAGGTEAEKEALGECVHEAERTQQSALVRAIFRNPFQAVARSDTIPEE